MLPPHSRSWLGRLVLAVVAVLTLALAASPRGVDAASEPFTVRDLPIDAQAQSAADARNRAIAKGQREAYQLMLSRVVVGDELNRLPPLDDKAINALIEGFEIANERIAPTRYRANLTVAFNESLVRAMLKQGGVRFVESSGRPVVVIPVLMTEEGPRLWQDDNLWLRAWSVRDKPPGLTPIIVPLGDASDIEDLDIGEVMGGDLQPLIQFARRYGADEALVLEARPRGSSVMLSGRHIVGGSVSAFADEVPGGEGQSLDAVLAVATEQVAARLDAEVKSAAEIRSGTVNSVRAIVPLKSLGEWVGLRATLTAMPIVQSIEIVALARTGADIIIHYFGEVSQLEAALAANNLALSPNGGDDSFVLAPRLTGSSVVGSLSRQDRG